jgi:mono/diheme cytochrome c family protein
MFHKLLIFALVALFSAGVAHAQSKNATSRGELLYATHCIGCHNTQLHWRDTKLATDWPRLKAEVDRWQKATGLRWRDEDVTEVARYLNARYYHFTAPVAGRSINPDATKVSRQQD